MRWCRYRHLRRTRPVVRPESSPPGGRSYIRESVFVSLAKAAGEPCREPNTGGFPPRRTRPLASSDWQRGSRHATAPSAGSPCNTVATTTVASATPTACRRRTATVSRRTAPCRSVGLALSSAPEGERSHSRNARAVVRRGRGFHSMPSKRPTPCPAVSVLSLLAGSSRWPGLHRPTRGSPASPSSPRPRRRFCTGDPTDLPLLRNGGAVRGAHRPRRRRARPARPARRHHPGHRPGQGSPTARSATPRPSSW